jgi:hypothetical protein
MLTTDRYSGCSPKLVRDVRRDRLAVDRLRRDDEEGDRVDRRERARRQHRPLHALLASVGEKLADVAKVSVGVVIHGALRADRERLAHLRDHDADLARGNLHPRVLVHPVDRPQTESPSRHEEVGLISRLARERDHVAGVELRPEPLRRQADFGGPDVDQRLEEDEG